MNEHDDEKLIRSLFSDLKRSAQDFQSARKEQIWLSVLSYIRESRLQMEREKSLSFWKWLALPRTMLRLSVTVVVVVLSLTLVGGAAYAQPGQTLYPVKIAAEQVELVLASNDEAKVKVGIKHAKRRLAEVQALVQENKDSKIVQATLDALKTTTDEVVKVAATAETKPQLASDAAHLAAEQEEVLSTVGNTAGNNEVKDAVQNAITAAKETRSKLEGDEEIKGVTTLEATSTPTPSTTPSVTTPSVLAAPVLPPQKSPKKDTTLGAPIQIDEVITIGDDNKTTPVGK